MVHRVSKLGIVGMGALGQAFEQFLTRRNLKSPGAILFCVKAFDLEEALKEQANLWPMELPFVILSNGYIWPIVEKLSPILGSRPIRIGMTTIGSTIQPDGGIQVFSDNTITAWGNWGPSQSRPGSMEIQTLGCFPNSSWSEDIRPMIRQKWILNVVINTLGGAYKLPCNSYVEQHREEAEALLKEAWELSKKLFDGLSHKLSLDEIQGKLWALVQATGGNENSMAKDVRLGRKTESDYLAGIALNYSNYPIMKALHEKVIIQP